MAAFPGQQAFVAHEGTLRSVPWLGRLTHHVELHLDATFSVGGRITFPSLEPGEGDDRRISVEGLTGNIWRTLTNTRDVPDGPWGPFEVPLFGAGMYRVRVEGWPWTPQEAAFKPPSPGSHLSFDFQIQRGLQLWFQALDEEQDVVLDSEVRVNWTVTQPWKHTNFVRARADERGAVDVSSVPRGMVRYQVEAPGFASYRSELVHTSALEGWTTTVILNRAGRLTGSCLHGGEAVENFTVGYWRSGLQDLAVSRTFTNREDGSFELIDVPLGEVSITASSPRFPACEPVFVEIEPNQESYVDLILPAPLLGRGRVIDAVTREPVADARVQLKVTGEFGSTEDWGPPHTVALDGSFEIAGFVRGDNFVTFSAQGYGDFSGVYMAAPDEDLDLGEVGLHRSQTLEIVLTGSRSDSSRDYSGFTAHLDEVSELPKVAFSRDGVARIENVRPGRVRIIVTAPDDSHTRFAVTLVSGETWRIEHRVAGKHRLIVEAVADNPSDIPDPYWIGASYDAPDLGYLQAMKRSTDGEPVTFDGIDSDTVQVRVIDALSNVLAETSISFDDRSQAHLSIRLGGREVTVRVEDGSGEPLTGVRVTLFDPHDPSIKFLKNTAGNGECIVQGLPEREMRAHLFHNTAGNAYEIPCDASGDEITLVLEAEEEISLRVLDGKRPIHDVRCSVVDSFGTYFGLFAMSDSEGKVTFPTVAAGRYGIRARRAGYWTVETRVEAKEGITTDVQIRQLGNLELELKSGGLSVSGQWIGLTSLEFETDVADWIDEGSVESDGLETDGKGRVWIDGLPHGTYYWRVESADGETFGGELVVVPGESSSHPIFLP